MKQGGLPCHRHRLGSSGVAILQGVGHLEMANPYYQQQDQWTGAVPVSQASGEARLAFLRKVYGILFSGIMVFFLTTAVPVVLFMAGTEVGAALVRSILGVPQLLWLGILLVVTFVASAVAHKPGINLIAFYSVALVYGLITVPLILWALLDPAVPASEQGSTILSGMLIVLQALALTTFVMGGLTAYVFITKKDFSWMGGILFIGLALVIGAVVVILIATALGYGNFDMLHIAISFFCVILFSGYVLYDTSRILHHYTEEMAVAGALSLLIDFVMLFRSILFLLLSRR